MGNVKRSEIVYKTIFFLVDYSFVKQNSLLTAVSALHFQPKNSIFVINERRTAISAHSKSQGQGPKGSD